MYFIKKKKKRYVEKPPREDGCFKSQQTESDTKQCLPLPFILQRIQKIFNQKINQNKIIVRTVKEQSGICARLLEVLT